MTHLESHVNNIADSVKTFITLQLKQIPLIGVITAIADRRSNRGTCPIEVDAVENLCGRGIPAKPGKCARPNCTSVSDAHTCCQQPSQGSTGQQAACSTIADLPNTCTVATGGSNAQCAAANSSASTCEAASDTSVPANKCVFRSGVDTFCGGTSGLKSGHQKCHSHKCVPGHDARTCCVAPPYVTAEEASSSPDYEQLKHCIEAIEEFSLTIAITASTGGNIGFAFGVPLSGMIRHCVHRSLATWTKMNVDEAIGDVTQVNTNKAGDEIEGTDAHKAKGAENRKKALGWFNELCMGIFDDAGTCGMSDTVAQKSYASMIGGLKASMKMDPAHEKKLKHLSNVCDVKFTIQPQFGPLGPGIKAFLSFSAKSSEEHQHDPTAPPLLHQCRESFKSARRLLRMRLNGLLNGFKHTMCMKGTGLAMNLVKKGSITGEDGKRRELIQEILRNNDCDDAVLSTETRKGKEKTKDNSMDAALAKCSNDQAEQLPDRQVVGIHHSKGGLFDDNHETYHCCNTSKLKENMKGQDVTSSRLGVKYKMETFEDLLAERSKHCSGQWKKMEDDIDAASNAAADAAGKEEDDQLEIWKTAKAQRGESDKEYQQSMQDAGALSGDAMKNQDLFNDADAETEEALAGGSTQRTFTFTGEIGLTSGTGCPFCATIKQFTTCKPLAKCAHNLAKATKAAMRRQKERLTAWGLKKVLGHGLVVVDDAHKEAWKDMDIDLKDSNTVKHNTVKHLCVAKTSAHTPSHWMQNKLLVSTKTTKARKLYFLVQKQPSQPPLVLLESVKLDGSEQDRESKFRLQILLENPNQIVLPSQLEAKMSKEAIARSDFLKKGRQLRLTKDNCFGVHPHKQEPFEQMRIICAAINQKSKDPTQPDLDKATLEAFLNEVKAKLAGANPNSPGLVATSNVATQTGQLEPVRKPLVTCAAGVGWGVEFGVGFNLYGMSLIKCNVQLSRLLDPTKIAEFKDPRGLLEQAADTDLLSSQAPGNL